MAIRWTITDANESNKNIKLMYPGHIDVPGEPVGVRIYVQADEKIDTKSNVIQICDAPEGYSFKIHASEGATYCSPETFLSLDEIISAALYVHRNMEKSLEREFKCYIGISAIYANQDRDISARRIINAAAKMIK